ncbi:hypothetical protein EDD15DRAFT_229685 [Pisolithus albus]|nr:hypothetical protein EDD15DRAFT_229685 [Pisolithus albus]
MGLINPSPGVIDSNDYRALKPLYEVAKQVGVWIVLRPGTLRASSIVPVLIVLRTLYKCAPCQIDSSSVKASCDAPLNFTKLTILEISR